MEKEAGRARLDAALLSPTFAEPARLLQLVRDQLARSPLLVQDADDKVDLIAEKKAAGVWELLEGLRSARQELFQVEDDSPSSWKIKQETDTMRVMYRPGPEKTPFHTYCLEGVIQGPLLNAACVAWEVPSHHAWWPQFTVPTFKILESRWIKRIRVGEDLALVRVKVPWPLAQREALLTQFEVEHWEDDILLILLGTPPSDPNDIQQELYGFSADDIPPQAPDTVRIDVNGGLMVQKLSSEHNFFRIIVDMDIKLDFVPPAIINFITRQLAGSGYKLFQKAVLASCKSTGSAKLYQSLLAREPLYARLRTRMEEAESRKKEQQGQQLLRLGNGLEEQTQKISIVDEQERQSFEEQDIVEEQPLRLQNGLDKDQKLKMVDQQELEVQQQPPPNGLRLNPVKKSGNVDVGIDPEVVWALHFLDKMISYVQEWNPRSPEQGSSSHGSEQGGSEALVQESVAAAYNSTPNRDGVFTNNCVRNGGVKQQQLQVRPKQQQQQQQLQVRPKQQQQQVALKGLKFWKRK